MVKENNSSMFSSINFSLKTWILISICMQNAGYTLLRKYSRMTEDVSSTEILLFSEVIKISIAIYATLKDAQTPDADSSVKGQGLDRLHWLVIKSWKMFVLAAIYGVMNILSFVALQYIGAGEFTICAQLKVLTTASFSVMILGTSLSNTKWRALVLLVLGCILVASPSFLNVPESEKDKKRNEVLGYAAVLTEVLLSGFASIYFEKVVKSTTEVVTIWERNFQLAVYSIIMYGGIMCYESFTSQRVVFANWSMLSVIVAVLGATGGLLVAATLKYADSILKTMATAGAIVLSTILGHYFLDGPFTTIVCIGAVVTIVAIMNYTFDATPHISNVN